MTLQSVLLQKILMGQITSTASVEGGHEQGMSHAKETAAFVVKATQAPKIQLEEIQRPHPSGDLQ